jgi:hypothetical protein
LSCIIALFIATDARAQTVQRSDIANYNGQDFTRPENSIEARLQFRESEADQTKTDREMLRLRYSVKIPLDRGWKIGAYAELPYSVKQIDDTSFGTTNHANGLDDVALQAALIQTLNAHWAYGFGVRLVAPTGAAEIGANEWQIQPGVGVRVSFSGLGGDSYFVPVVRYAMSNGDGRRISEPQFAPTLNIGFPNRWFVTFYPSNDIRVNFGERISGQTGRLFLPFDVAAGKKLSDTLSASVEVGIPIVDDYPVYKFKSELRLVMQLP